jgi:nucleotide-binding universal stress UspA family protein
MNPPQGTSPSYAEESAEERIDTPPGSVVVGVDGSPDSDRAVDWAFAEAARRARGLHLTCAVTLLVDDPGGPDAQEGLYSRAKSVLAAAAARGSEHFNGEITFDLAVGPASARLVRASAVASLVVVGSRGHGGFAGLVIGSVSQHVARHAECPVVVVREPADRGSDRVLVGVDNSEPAFAALGLAFDLAARAHTSVLAVGAWRQSPMSGPGIATPTAHDNVERSRHEQELLDAALATWRGKYPDVPVVSEAIPGHPARVLLDASAHAACVVVGSRGRGAFAGMLLGSTSQELLHHARCTVVIVR